MIDKNPFGTRAFLLGRPGRHPFAGHLRLRLTSQRSVLDIAAALASADPVEAWDVVRVLEAALLEVDARSQNAGWGRLVLMRAAWEAIAAIDPARLGPGRGDDLAALLVGQDDEGLGVGATGLEGLWGLRGDHLEALVPPAHPIFSIQGVPALPPPVLAPHQPPLVLVGAPSAGALPVPRDASWPRLCGWHAPETEMETGS